MPREISALSPRKGRSASYDWDTFLDGTPRAFEQGFKDDDGEVIVAGDFYCEPGSFESMARTAGAKKVKVHARNLTETVEVIREDENGEAIVTEIERGVVELSTSPLPVKDHAAE